MKIINLYLKKCACLDASTTLPLHVEGVIRRNSPLQNTTITIIRNILSTNCFLREMYITHIDKYCHN